LAGNERSTMTSPVDCFIHCQAAFPHIQAGIVPVVCGCLNSQS
jgi:hypothetical protein